MQAGVALFAQNYTDRERHDRGDRAAEPRISDNTIFQEEIVVGDLVEPLGFDSMWTVEHHFAMTIPAPVLPEPSVVSS
jgi:alkanesulfonate monooxygenase SsuD/methylene tetrahydromethanopterin reductase-like flavin-dependent oxidoreductase (luciferase family)